MEAKESTMKKYIVSVCYVMVGFFLIMNLVTEAYAFEIGARGYYWFPELKGNLRVDQGGITGTQVDLKDDLGISNESFPSVEVFAGIGKHHVSFMYTQFHYSGTKIINQNIIFSGQTYAANALVESDLKTKMLDLEYQYDVINLENILAGFSIGIIGKLKYLDAEASMKSPTPGSQSNQTETFALPVPMVGLGMHIGVLKNILEFRAKGAGMGYGSNVFYEALADISVTPFPFLDIHAGYRIMRLKVDDISDVYGDLKFYGPYAALTVSF